MTQKDSNRADRIIQFINLLPIVDGPAVGQRFKVDPWQELWIREIYEPFNGEGRIVRRAALSCGRKNAKSYLVSGLLLAHLIGPEAQPNGQVYSCACDRQQAAIIFDMCRKMIDMAPELKKRLKAVPSTKTIYVKTTDTKGRGSQYKALSSESSTKHGLGADFFVYDEFGESSLKDELWDTMLDGQQARKEPLAVAISTQNNDANHPFSLMLDDGLRGDDPSLVCHLHAADEDCDLLDKEQWFKANPSLKTWRSITPVEIAAKEAARLPSKEANFRRRYLNQRVSPFSTFISMSDWKAAGARPSEIPKGAPIYLGLDLSRATDLTALVAITAGDESRMQSWFWKPLEAIEEHSKRDRQRYDLWVQQDKLLTTSGRSIDLKSVAYKIGQLADEYEIIGLAYDRYRMADLIRLFEQIGLHCSKKGETGGVPLFDWGQGYVDMAPAVDALEHEILTGTLAHDNNPVQNMCAMNAVLVTDPSGNRKLDKNKSTLRIDGIVAGAMACGLKSRICADVIPQNPWDDADFNLLDYLN